jgi:hypothetical protein
VNDGTGTANGFTNVTVNPAASGNGFFSLNPPVFGPVQVGTNVTLRARMWGSQFGLPAGPLGNFGVVFTITGPNARTVNLLTDGNGDVAYTYTSAVTGTDTINAVGNGGTFGTFNAKRGEKGSA